MVSIKIDYGLWKHQAYNMLIHLGRWKGITCFPRNIRKNYVPRGLFNKNHLCLRRKIKSLWLWKVTTFRPLNSGSMWKRDPNILPTEWPSLVLKLLRITSGRCLVAFPCLWNWVLMKMVWSWWLTKSIVNKVHFSKALANDFKKTKCWSYHRHFRFCEFFSLLLPKAKRS